MEINIKVFRKSGKFYTDAIAIYPKNTPYPLNEPNFNEWLDEVNPARISLGFVVVSMNDEKEFGFCEHLFRLDVHGYVDTRLY